jgi:hypothetical protein
MTDPLTTAQYPAVRVVCAGVVRSGSMWAFNVVRRLLELAPPERHVSWEWAEGTELDSAVWRTLGSDHHVIKCHEESGGFLSALDAQFVNGIVLSLRDPVASLASCMEQFVNREPFSHHWNSRPRSAAPTRPSFAGTPSPASSPRPDRRALTRDGASR